MQIRICPEYVPTRSDSDVTSSSGVKYPEELMAALTGNDSIVLKTHTFGLEASQEGISLKSRLMMKAQSSNGAVCKPSPRTGLCVRGRRLASSLQPRQLIAQLSSASIIFSL